MTMLDELTRLVPATAAVPRTFDWPDVERRLGTAVPADFRALVETYGSGEFDEFLTVLVPAHENPHLDVAGRRDSALDALHKVAEYEPAPQPMPYPIDQLLPWAVTANGDTCYWLMEGGPDGWPTVVNEGRGPEWDAFDGTATEFLVETLSGRVRIAVFPDDFPSEAPTFSPWL